MSDAPEDIRERAIWAELDKWKAGCLANADEAKDAHRVAYRLRLELIEVMAERDAFAADCLRLRGENDRLRAALTENADFIDPATSPHPVTAAEAAGRAYAALGSSAADVAAEKELERLRAEDAAWQEEQIRARPT